MSLFSSLKGFGLKNLSNLEIYDKKEENVGKQTEQNVEVEFNEEDFLFDKSYECPVCDFEFKTKTIRAGKVKLLETDIDLRPKYKDVDCLKYETIVCPNCGYANLSRNFNTIMNSQLKLIKENISPNFKYTKPENEFYTYDEAILRHKLALFNSIVKKSKISERAYICLKLAWLMRGKAESLSEDTKDYDNLIQVLEKEELEFLKNAYEGFTQAISNELFPISGMDEFTLTYLLAALALELKEYSASSKLISKILTTRDVNNRIKNKVIDLKDILAQEIKNSKA